ncbi:hypothetical protein OG455_41165 [Kitasatospora sp. NBC_01287]|uniref:hypothetical protein n=1 Tax=Kitasatospora sp. NBC_01287 TaxID=2903573 RepID=UPI00224FBBC6|nr:hypothetical protein [Kitasatospora sp. NBC_01287]MCX4750893.1 hypothetical protein [Kitasatospora sp. NBC_01287]MCX4751852.1 hypothetical protein [Kitasatospora sp. NBC_01287]
MATSVTTSLPMWLTGCTYDGSGGNDLRNSGVTAFFFDPGITTGSTIGLRSGVVGGAGLYVQPGTGMNVLVQPGSFVVANSSNVLYGGYASTLASQATLSVATADPTNPRIDLIVAYVSDVGTSASFGAVAIITGTPGPAPSAPSAPANSLTLSQLSVPAGTSTITSGLLTEKRVFTTAAGGVLVAVKGSASGYLGQLAYDPTSGAFYHNNNLTAATQLKVLPWQPAMTKLTTPYTVSDSAEHTIISTTVTTDGYTDIECFFKSPGVQSATTSSSKIRPFYRLYLDSTLLDSIYAAEATADSYIQSGVAWSYYTSPSTADTPSAGTHTVSVSITNTLSSIQFSQFATTSTAASIILRVKPVST